MVIFLIIVIGLTVWALHLLQASIKSRDLSLALASSLVGISAVGVVMVYTLMDGYMSYFSSAHLAEFPTDATVVVPAVLYEPELVTLAPTIELAGATESVSSLQERLN
jgi:hypothetical protein